MRMDELKRGFWGYKKDSVYNYIVTLEEEASRRVAEKDARIDRQEAEFRRQIAELESAYKKKVVELDAMMASLQEENQALRDNQEFVFSTMLEAQKYADRLKADSVRQVQQAQEELSTAVEQENQQLDGYVKRIRQLRAMIRDLLEEFDDKAEESEKALIRLPAQAPSADLGRQILDIKALSEDIPAVGAENAMSDAKKGEKWNKLSFI